MKKNEFSKNVDLEVLNSISKKCYFLDDYLYNEEYTPIQICALMLREGGFDTGEDDFDLNINIALANWFIRYKYYDEEDFSNEYNDIDNYNWEELYKDAEEIAYDIINTYFEEKENIAC